MEKETNSFCFSEPQTGLVEVFPRPLLKEVWDINGDEEGQEVLKVIEFALGDI